MDTNFAVTTFDGRKVPINQMTHQHLSNWVWFAKVILRNISLSLFYENKCIEQHGKVLDYHPHPEFKEEHTYLRNMGLVDKEGNIYRSAFKEPYEKIGKITKKALN